MAHSGRQRNDVVKRRIPQQRWLRRHNGRRRSAERYRHDCDDEEPCHLQEQVVAGSRQRVARDDMGEFGLRECAGLRCFILKDDVTYFSHIRGGGLDLVQWQLPATNEPDHE
jgi:hypothetical protein